MRWKCFTNRKVLCIKCSKDITNEYMGHCSGCYSNTCSDCKVNYYTCDGGHHSFSRYACDLCISKANLNKIVNGKYYCPLCCPEDDSDEYKFKRDFYHFQEDEIEFYFLIYNITSWRMYSLSKEELNNPKNWKEHANNPYLLKNKIKKHFREQFKPKKVWRVKNEF